MSAALTNRTRAAWLFDPTAAATASLVTVTFFTLVLGIGFLPRELQLLSPSQYVSVTHSIVGGSDRPSVSLYWTIAQSGSPGWRHHLALHSAAGVRSGPPHPWPQLNPLSLAKGADDDHVLVGDWDGRIHSIDTRHPQSEPACIGRQPDGGVIALASSADGQYVVSQSAFHLHCWDTTTKRERWRLHEVAAYCFALRADSATAITGSLRGDLVEIDLASGRTLQTLAGLGVPVLSLTLSPDGHQLAALCSNGDLVLLDSHTAGLAWQEPTRPTCQTCCGRFAVFSPCGQWLVTAGQHSSKNLTVWSVATGQKLCELQGHERVVQGAAFAADGSLRSWSADGTIRLWDMAAGDAREVISIEPPRQST